MEAQSQAYIFALLASACFSSASLFYTDISRKISPLWMNGFKASVAWIGFALAVVAMGPLVSIDRNTGGALLFSGALGLGLGDAFLLIAFSRMGSARTLILYGFQPLFMGLAAHFLFGQDITWVRVVAILFFIACLATFSLEKFRAQGHWEIIGLSAALVGVFLDNCGVILSRWSFDRVPGLNAIEANLFRCTGAIIFFVALGLIRPMNWRIGWGQLNHRWRVLALGSAVSGTFLALILYMTAIKIGHLASISALGVAGPILAAGMECLYLRKAPSRYLLLALGFFLIGVALLTLGN